MRDHYDFVIIGSGFGGSVSALRLAQKGYSVAVLEAGRRFADQEFPKTNWNLFKWLWAPALRCFGIMRITLLDDVLILSGTGVGGGSLCYANTLLQPSERFYRDPQWAEMADWQTILAPHYDTAKQMLGVTRVVERTPADDLLHGVAEELGCADSFRMQEVGVYFGEPEQTVPDPYFDGEGPERTGCRHCGGCMVGCRYNAKNTLVKNYLYLAEKLGVEVFANTTATLVREADGGEGYAIDTRRTSSPFGFGKRTFRGAQVVFAGGVLGTVPLLMRCKERGALPRLSPALGRRARTNSETLGGVTATRGKVDYSKGVAITSSIYVDDVTHIEPVRYSNGSDVMAFFGTPLTDGTPRSRPWRWLGGIFRHPIRFLRTLWPFGWAKNSVIFLVMQTLDSSIEMRLGRRWWWPFKKSLRTYRESGRERVPALIPQAQAAGRTAERKYPVIAQNNWPEVLLNTGFTAHILGGCAIGPDPEHGVIDGQNRVYGHPGLYVVDGSMIPANLGVNPSLTITAMAEQAMSHVPPKGD